MSIKVKTFDEEKLKQSIKESPEIIKDYIQALLNIVEMSKQTATQALSELRKTNQSYILEKEKIDAVVDYLKKEGGDYMQELIDMLEELKKG